MFGQVPRAYRWSPLGSVIDRSIVRSRRAHRQLLAAGQLTRTPVQLVAVLPCETRLMKKMRPITSTTVATMAQVIALFDALTAPC
jgi:hypothetical protein